MADTPISTQPSSPAEKPKEIKPQMIPVASPHVLYCSSVILQISKEEAVLSFISGGAIAQEFAFSLPHLKRLHEALTKNIAAYEQKYGITISTNRDDLEEVKHDSPSV